MAIRLSPNNGRAHDGVRLRCFVSSDIRAGIMVGLRVAAILAADAVAAADECVATNSARLIAIAMLAHRQPVVERL